jgi:hypothetical protein
MKKNVTEKVQPPAGLSEESTVTEQITDGEDAVAGDVVPQLEERWERLNQHHVAAGQSFIHNVLAGIEVVRLKLALPHGKFSKAVAEKAGDISPRTVRHYRQIGERYLSAVHSGVMTVRNMRKSKTMPEEELCAGEYAENFLTEKQIRSDDDLKQFAEKIVTDLAKRASAPGTSRVENIFRKVRRSWSRMTKEQKEEFGKRFDDLRIRPVTSPATPEPEGMT